MTTLVSQIRKFDPFFVGFDQLFNNLVNFDFDRSPTTYPPYNIVQDDDYTYAIELAVAGFGEDDISIEHKPENGVLTIEGKAPTNGTQNAIYKGIAERSFSRNWTLADNVEVIGASLENGLLRVELERQVPEEKKSKTIKIGTKKTSGKKQLLTEEE
jgi:molecular chaperone IbpA